LIDFKCNLCRYTPGWKEFYPESDTAADAQTFAVDVRPGDALIMGSDGLWDNVPAAEVAGVCAALVKEGKGAQEVAEAIATVAFEHSVGALYKLNAVEATHSLRESAWFLPLNLKCDLLVSQHFLCDHTFNLRCYASVDEEYDSPFTQEARRSGYDVEWWEKAQGKELVGGKMDDIAVVVVFMDEEGKCPVPPPPEEVVEEEEEGSSAASSQEPPEKEA
jgi:hypothetical protein